VNIHNQKLALFDLIEMKCFSVGWKGYQPKVM